MPYELFLALRYLLAKRKQTFLSLISLISVLGITVGVTALIIALSLATGFQEDIRGKILGANAHITVFAGLGSSNLIAFGDPEGSETRINSEIQLIGGSLAAAVGGIGHFATLDILLDPTPELPTGFDDFLAGYPGVLENSLSGGVVWSITMTPEPGTGLLLGSALVALGVHGRRRRRQ